MAKPAVLLIANPDKPQAARLAEAAAAWLAGRAEVLGVETSADGDLSRHAADIAVVFGGDGTVLSAVRRLAPRRPRLLAVNLGRLAYLAEAGPDELNQTLERALAGSCRLSLRMLLAARLLAGGRELWRGEALNEFVIAPALAGRMIRLEVKVDGRLLTTVAGDGLIVATPTGSTAYSLSAGGPIVNPELRATLLVPISPHQLANRPLVLGEDEVLTISHAESREVRLMADGDGGRVLPPGGEVEIRPAGEPVKFVVDCFRGRYDVLREKLGWGRLFGG